MIRTAPPLPVANVFAAQELASLGAASVHAQIELGRCDAEELVRRSPVPVEIYCAGRPVLLATRAGVADVRSVSDVHGERFLVRKSGCLTLLHPAVSMSIEPEIPCGRIFDFRTADSETAVSEFNWGRGLF